MSTWDVLEDAFPDEPLFASLAPTSEKYNIPGSVDVHFHLNLGETAFDLACGEYKAPEVKFWSDVSVAALYQETMANPPPKGEHSIQIKRGTLTSLMQAFTYCVLGTPDKYGWFSNWNLTAFFTRRVEEGRDIVYCSRWFGLDEVRLAHAYFVHLMVRDVRDGTYPRERGAMAPIPPWIEKTGEWAPDKKDEEDNGGGGGGGPLAAAAAALAAGAGANPVTSTKAALGIEALMFVEPFTVLSNSDKSHTRLVHINGRALVAKFVNFHRIPGDWTSDSLKAIEENEARVYHHLQALQHDVIPEYVYRGQDFNFIFVTVTTYEGMSLDRLAERDGYLALDLRLRALAALRRIHQVGVLHGDIALRNCVWRERDGAVLWVDFEMAHVCQAEDDAARFDAEAKEELAELQALWREIPVSAKPVIEIVAGAAAGVRFATFTRFKCRQQ